MAEYDLDQLPQLIPVIDVQQSRAVRGVGGRRSEYQSVLQLRPTGLESDEPLEVARWYRRRWSLSTLYVADLDAIAGFASNASCCEALSRDGFELYVDAAWGAPQDLDFTASAHSLLQNITPVFSTETLGEPRRLKTLASAASKNTVLSIDLYRGEKWRGAVDVSIDPNRSLQRDHHKTLQWVIPWLEAAIEARIQRVLLLDLADVGNEGGVSTLELLAECRALAPELRWWVGGGVRGPSDARQAKQAGAEAVLVASAFLTGQWLPVASS